MNRVSLTKQQRDQVDQQVMDQIRSGTARQKDIAAKLDSWMVGSLPPRTDRARYVDQSITRLSKAKRIKKLAGHYGWEARGQAKGKSSSK